MKIGNIEFTVSKKELKKIKRMTIELATIAALILLLWRGLELLLYKQIMPNTVDSIIGLILLYSLYANLQVYKGYKRLKDRGEL